MNEKTPGPSILDKTETNNNQYKANASGLVDATKPPIDNGEVAVRTIATVAAELEVETESMERSRAMVFALTNELFALMGKRRRGKAK